MSLTKDNLPDEYMVQIPDGDISGHIIDAKIKDFELELFRVFHDFNLQFTLRKLPIDILMALEQEVKIRVKELRKEILK